MRINARWSGELRRAGLVEYEYKLEYHKRRLVGFKIGIEAYGDYDFVLRRETWFDRWCKKLGVVVEHQIGRDDFDKEIYIVSDDPQFCDVLSSNSAVVEHVLRMFRSETRHFCELKEIRYNKEKLWLDYEVKVIDGFNENTI